MSRIVAALAAAVVGLSPAAARAASAPPANPPTRTSSIWSGYVVTGQFHRIAADWTEPRVDCDRPGWIQRLAPWVGLNGYLVGGHAALPLMQTGTLTLCHSDPALLAALPGSVVDGLAASASAAGTAGSVPFTGLIYLSEALNAGFGLLADAACLRLPGVCDWAADAYSWAEAYPEPPVPYPDAVALPGDRMHAEVRHDNGRYVMTLADVTRHWTRTTVRVSRAPARSAEVVVEGLLSNPLPRFTPVRFANVTVDGRPLAAAGGLTRTVLLTVDGARTEPSPLVGSGFSIP